MGKDKQREGSKLRKEQDPPKTSRRSSHAIKKKGPLSRPWVGPAWSAS
jgi:hypothetical protein